jgi:hypothetical protein
MGTALWNDLWQPQGAWRWLGDLYDVAPPPVVGLLVAFA